MFAALKKYWVTARLCARQMSYFGLADLMGGYLLRLAQMAVMLMVWSALFRQGADMQGMTLNQMLRYTLLSSALQPLLDVRTPATAMLHSGELLSPYQRPMPVFGQLIAQTVGGWAMGLLLYSLPCLVMGALFGLSPIPDSPWFFLSLLLSMAQGFAVDFLFACLQIHLKSMEWTIHVIRGALNALLTGAVIPFAALPWGIGEFLSLTPFGTMAGAPLSLFGSLDGAARLIPAQLIWTAALWPLAVWAFHRSRERMVSYGG